MSGFSNVVSSILPWLSAAVAGGPVGVATLAVGKIAAAIGLPETAAPAEVQAKLNTLSPDQLLALQKYEMDFKKEMQDRGYKNQELLAQLDLGAIEAVNATMRVELENSDKESWYQKAWRPACGFAVAIGSFAGVLGTIILLILGIFYGKPEAINAIPQLAMAIAAILAVPGAAVGIAAWNRGVMQIEEVRGKAAAAAAKKE